MFELTYGYKHYLYGDPSQWRIFTLSLLHIPQTCCELCAKMLGVTQFVFLFYQSGKYINIDLLWFIVQFKLFLKAPDFTAIRSIIKMFLNKFHFNE